MKCYTVYWQQAHSSFTLIPVHTIVSDIRHNTASMNCLQDAQDHVKPLRGPQ